MRDEFCLMQCAPGEHIMLAVGELSDYEILAVYRVIKPLGIREAWSCYAAFHSRLETSAALDTWARCLAQQGYVEPTVLAPGQRLSMGLLLLIERENL